MIQLFNMLSEVFFKSSSYWTNSSGKKVDLTTGSDLCTEDPSQGGGGHTFDFESYAHGTNHFVSTSLETYSVKNGRYSQKCSWSYVKARKYSQRRWRCILNKR